MFSCNLTKDLEISLQLLYPQKPEHKMQCLEIGSFEGKGSLVIEKTLCSHKDSQLICIDPLENFYVQNNSSLEFWNKVCVGQQQRFLKNTEHSKKILLWKGYSDDMIPKLENFSLDFVYVDGDHSELQVYKDAINVWEKVKPGGIILFDDYLFKKNGVETKLGIDKFLLEKRNYFKVLIKSYQLAIQKNDI